MKTQAKIREMQPKVKKSLEPPEGGRSKAGCFSIRQRDLGATGPSNTDFWPEHCDRKISVVLSHILFGGFCLTSLGH